MREDIEQPLQYLWISKYLWVSLQRSSVWFHSSLATLERNWCFYRVDGQLPNQNLLEQAPGRWILRNLSTMQFLGVLGFQKKNNLIVATAHPGGCLSTVWLGPSGQVSRSSMQFTEFHWDVTRNLSRKLNPGTPEWSCLNFLYTVGSEKLDQKPFFECSLSRKMIFMQRFWPL